MFSPLSRSSSPPPLPAPRQMNRTFIHLWIFEGDATWYSLVVSNQFFPPKFSRKWENAIRAFQVQIHNNYINWISLLNTWWFCRLSARIIHSKLPANLKYLSDINGKRFNKSQRWNRKRERERIGTKVLKFSQFSSPPPIRNFD